MENFRIGIFELFSGLIPGFPALVVLFSFYTGIEIIELDWGSIMVRDYAVSSMIALSLLSYIVGFTLQYPAYELFKIIFSCVPFWKKRKHGHEISLAKRGKDIARIRSRSPESFKILNTFMALRTMCYTLFFSLTIMTTVIVIQSIYNDSSKSIFPVVSILIIFTLILLRRAVSFHEWCQKLITETNNIQKQK